jgi:hypothetical protein
MEVHAPGPSHPAGQHRRQATGPRSLTGMCHRNSEREY